MGVNLKQHRRLLLLWSFATSFTKTALNSDFIYIFFMILYMLGQGQITPMG